MSEIFDFRTKWCPSWRIEDAGKKKAKEVHELLKDFGFSNGTEGFWSKYIPKGLIWIKDIPRYLFLPGEHPPLEREIDYSYNGEDSLNYDWGLMWIEGYIQDDFFHKPFPNTITVESQQLRSNKDTPSPTQAEGVKGEKGK